MVRALDELPAANFPLLAEVVDERAAETPTDEFEFGLEVIIAGLTARLAAK
ncbi:TetR/AcrR family transcriptional regulator C-terminal domain-containing protein [Nocardia asiatica]|uniref:TetR/AcrR family transcriptional regulator C-terminal domain-containing protein n=1 Tax=Nocardia asiatica TaxID=209252 RepID=UPI003EE20540